MSILRIKNLHKSYTHGTNTTHVLKGINTHIKKGEVVVVIGPSGSGKSTFLRCLNLLEEPTKGIIEIDNISTKSDGDTSKITFSASVYPGQKLSKNNLESLVVFTNNSRQRTGVNLLIPLDDRIN